LLSSPPASGVDFDKALETACPEDYAMLVSTLAVESGEQKGPGAADPNAATSTKVTLEAEFSETAVGEVPAHKALEQSARERAQGIMRHNPGVVILSPQSWCSQSLQTLLAGQVSLASMGKAIGFFDPKADEDVRVHPGQNVFLNYPSVNRERLEAFMEAFNSIMTDSRDVAVIFEGRVVQNRQPIVQLIEKFRWNYREVSLISDKTAFDNLLRHGNSGKTKRVKRGFATGKFRENVYVCWKGRAPKMAAKTRKWIDAGSHVSDDVMMNVPVLSVDERPTVDATTKSEVLKGSTWAGKPPVGEDTDPEESSGSDSGGEAPKSSKKNETWQGIAAHTHG
jgi:hypothetical protein